MKTFLLILVIILIYIGIIFLYAIIFHYLGFFTNIPTWKLALGIMLFQGIISTACGRTRNENKLFRK